ncbi:hypothetical protein XH97_05785 [Bradyrhizobium sp. CCBAU 53380]|nr:hypothetical protein [Bradyrhizobium sp. CCBAU 53380]
MAREEPPFGVTSEQGDTRTVEELAAAVLVLLGRYQVVCFMSLKILVFLRPRMSAIDDIS